MPEVHKERSPDISEFDKLWDYNDPSGTEKKFREFLPELEGPDNVSLRLQLLTQIGRTLGLQMKFENAHKVLDEVESVLKLNEGHDIARIRYLLERGRTYNSSKKKDQAIELFLKAYEIALRHNEDFYAIDAAHMLGIAESPDEGLRWNEKAMKLAEASSNERARNWLGALYNNSAWTYHDRKEYDKALELFEKNVKLHTERKSKRPLIIAKWSVARALRSLAKINEAMEMHKNLLKEIEENKLEQDGYIFEELAECNLIKNNSEEAKKYFSLAYDLLSKDIWLAEYEKERLQRIKDLSS
ncbi:MAG: tetratricopeptide repeat protein [Ignavibacteria bacterium]